MISEEEQKFIRYWEARRENEGRTLTQLLKGIPMGLLFAMPVFILLFTSRFWYKRADMVATTQLNPFVFSLAIFLIVIFVSVFYKKHQWERNEQQYLEFKSKEESALKQEPDDGNAAK